MKAAIYGRYSSENQKEQSIDDQVRVCREYALKHDIHVLQEHIYFDEAASGSLRKRPGLEALKQAAEQKVFDAVMIDDSSRLSRDNQYFNTILCLFQFWGVDLISVSDGLNKEEWVVQDKPEMRIDADCFRRALACCSETLDSN